ncbi:MAG: TRAP transporter large permease subunit [Moraxellaceae bacterium]|nr:TRAP transporter large permease subunit [Moraxellaceae bacterium]
MTLLLILLLVLVAFMGAPLFAVIAGAAMIGFTQSETPLAVIGVELYRLVDTPILLALPLFTFAGYVLGESRTSLRLVRLTQSLIGWMPGGLAIVALFTCAFFTAFTGASGVTIVALGALLYPAMKQAGYQDRFSLGLVTTSGSLGLLLPPSLPLILYAVIAQQLPDGGGMTIQEVFKAGLLPALVMVACLSLYGLWVTRRHPIPLTRFNAAEVRAALWEAKWEVPLPFVVLGGIYGGFFAVSEAAAVTALYVVIVECLIYREISFKQLPKIMREAMVMVGAILIILGVSLAFTNWLIDAEVPTRLFTFIREHVDNRLMFLLLLNLFLLLLGCVLDIFSALFIMVPLLLPVAVGYGIDPVHLGIIFLANMQIGYCTPPVGMNLFMSSYRFNKPITELYAATWPFIIVLFISVLLITYIPWFSLALLGR